MNALLHFPPNFTPFDTQKEIIQEIDNAFDSGVKFCIVCAPTGSGKSFLAKTFANQTKDYTNDYKDWIKSYSALSTTEDGHIERCGAYALTITKSLQDQYKNLFEETEILKGKSNYTCEIDYNYDVESAPCNYTKGIKSSCWQKDICPYFKQRNNIACSRFSALNYSMYFALPKQYKEKELIICDEASEIEDELVRQYSATLNYRRLRKLGIDFDYLKSDDTQKAILWLCDIQDEIVEKIKSVQGHLKDGTPGKNLITDFKLLQKTGQSISNILKWSDKCEYVVDLKDDCVVFTPLYVSSIAQSIFKNADRVILMSATIIDPKNFAKSLGIENYKYIEVPSEFDSSKSPIHVCPKYNLNFKNLKQNLPAVIKLAGQICEKHKEEKGVIHTHTHYITSYYKQQFKSQDRFLYRDEENTNEEVLEMHSEAENASVIVSPSVTYGIDLKDDLSRFQIITKIPYLPMGDKRIKKLFERDKNWYENKMLNTLVQACGRSTRSKTDHSETYILDGNIVSILKRCKHKLPKHFLNRFV